jgi:hypothetical protein
MTKPQAKQSREIQIEGRSIFRTIYRCSATGQDCGGEYYIAGDFEQSIGHEEDSESGIIPQID